MAKSDHCAYTVSYHVNYCCILLTCSFIQATPDLIHQAKFALDVKKNVLPLYEEVFDIEYPLPKLDTLVVCKSGLYADRDLILINSLS